MFKIIFMSAMMFFVVHVFGAEKTGEVCEAENSVSDTDTVAALAEKIQNAKLFSERCDHTPVKCVGKGGMVHHSVMRKTTPMGQTVSTIYPEHKRGLLMTTIASWAEIYISPVASPAEKEQALNRKNHYEGELRKLESSQSYKNFMEMRARFSPK